MLEIHLAERHATIGDAQRDAEVARHEELGRLVTRHRLW
jgi:hypothetical protein